MKKIYLPFFAIIATSLQSFGLLQSNHGLRNDDISPLLWLFLIVLVITAGIVLYKFVSRSSLGMNSDPASDAESIIKGRFASGEVNKNTFNEILGIIRQESDKDYIEKLKVRLANGEITISEFSEMSELLTGK